MSYDREDLCLGILEIFEEAAVRYGDGPRILAVIAEVVTRWRDARNAMTRTRRSKPANKAKRSEQRKAEWAALSADPDASAARRAARTAYWRERSRRVRAEARASIAEVGANK